MLDTEFYLSSLGYRARIGRLPEHRVADLLRAAARREQQLNYQFAAPIALNTYVLALANGGKRDQLSPDDFNPFTPQDKKEGHADWDAVAVEILREHIDKLPLWLHEIINHCGVKPYKEPTKLQRSICRIYGCAWGIGIDPFQVGGVWHWSILIFKDTDTSYIPETVRLYSWESDDFVEMPGEFFRYWIDEGGTIYFGEVEYGSQTSNRNS